MSEYLYRINADDTVWGTYVIKASSDEEALLKLQRGDIISYEQEGFTDDSIPRNPEIIFKEKIEK